MFCEAWGAHLPTKYTPAISTRELPTCPYSMEPHFDSRKNSEQLHQGQGQPTIVPRRSSRSPRYTCTVENDSGRRR